MQFRLSHSFQLPPPPAPAEALLVAAGRHGAAGNWEAAEALCTELLARQPDHPEALHLRGVIATRRGQHEDACRWLERAAALAPRTARIHYHLGNAHLAAGAFAAAEAAFRQAAALDPDLPEALNNLGNALKQQHRLAEAIDCYRALLARHPSFAPALYNLGRALAEQGDPAAAVACLRAALATPPPPGEEARAADIHEALAAALVELGEHEAAIAASRAMQALAPGKPLGVWNEALSLLALGRYAEAWPGYERRWEMPGFRDAEEAGLPPPQVPTLSELAGKRVLLRWEQGRGDVIQFMRYATPVSRIAASVTLCVYPELRELAASVPGVACAITDADPEPAHDVAVSLMSLPLVFATTLASVPARIPYVTAPEPRRARWRETLAATPGPRVGLCWWGSEHSRRSSIPLPLLEPLLRVAGISFHAVQKEIPAAQRGLLAAAPSLRDHGAALVDFADTAAMLAALDLVITIDTAVAHLAGALGRPVWILLRRGADWRWLCARADSPWYPTARLFRQGAEGTWEPVVAAARTALEAWRAAQSPQPACLGAPQRRG